MEYGSVSAVGLADRSSEKDEKFQNARRLAEGRNFTGFNDFRATGRSDWSLGVMRVVFRASSPGVIGDQDVEREKLDGTSSTMEEQKIETGRQGSSRMTEDCVEEIWVGHVIFVRVLARVYAEAPSMSQVQKMWPGS